MNDAYLLEQLVRKVEAHLKALHENAKYPGDPKKDKIKEAYLLEVRRRREDLTGLIKKIRMVHPIPQEA